MLVMSTVTLSSFDLNPGTDFSEIVAKVFWGKSLIFTPISFRLLLSSIQGEGFSLLLRYLKVLLKTHMMQLNQQTVYYHTH